MYSKNIETTNDIETHENIRDGTDDSAETKEAGNDAADLPAMSDTERIEYIREIISNSDISDTKKWEALTSEQRIEALRVLGSEIAKVMGIGNAKIVFRSDLPKNVYGIYNHINGEVHIKRSLVNDAGQRLNALDTLCHEYRHAFQYAAIQNPEKYGIPPDLADKWRSNLPPYGIYLSAEKYGIDAYCKQPVERDAKEWEEKCRGDLT